MTGRESLEGPRGPGTRQHVEWTWNLDRASPSTCLDSDQRADKLSVSISSFCLGILFEAISKRRPGDALHLPFIIAAAAQVGDVCCLVETLILGFMWQKEA